jgi:SAM-dependent methyltransferase
LRPDPETLNYHLKQHIEPKRSTVHFADFCHERLETSKTVIDAGCGAGGPTLYLAKRFSNCRFLGIDVSVKLIAYAPTKDNLEFQVLDLEHLPDLPSVDGVVLMQVLSWMENYRRPLAQIADKLRPRWIAFSTLIYEHNIDCQIIVDEQMRPRRSYYNIYSLPRLNRFMGNSCGYRFVKSQPFDIDIDLEKPADPDLMGTYTLGLASGGRLQCSGPLVLPWHFVMYERAAP